MKKRPLIAMAANPASQSLMSQPRSFAWAAALVLVTFGGSFCLAATVPATKSGPVRPSDCQLVKDTAARNTCLTARAEYDKGNYRLSLTLTKKAQTASPNEGILRAQVARVLVRMGALGPAERELRQARTDGAPDDRVLPMLFAVMVARQDGVKLLNEFPEPAPNAKGDVAAAILQGRAMALRSTDRVAEAAAAMDRCLALGRTADKLLVRASIAKQQNDTALADKLVNEAYRLSPQDAAVMTAKLEQLERANDTAGVLALADRMQKLYPINSDPRESKIRIFIKHNQDARAQAEVDSLLALRRNSPVGRLYKAVLMSRAHDKRGAAQIIQGLPPEFLKAHPEYALQMAQIVLDNGNVESGAAILGTALGVAPDMLDVRLRLASLRLNQNSPQSAMVLLSPVKESPDPRVQKLLKQTGDRIAKNRAF